MSEIADTHELTRAMLVYAAIPFVILLLVRRAGSERGLGSPDPALPAQALS